MVVHYVEALVAQQASQEMDAAFLGTLKEALVKAAANPDSPDAATLLFMLHQLTGAYENEDVLFRLIDAHDVNARVLALHALTDLAKKLHKTPTEKGERKSYEEHKKRTGRRRSQGRGQRKPRKPRNPKNPAKPSRPRLTTRPTAASWPSWWTS